MFLSLKKLTNKPLYLTLQTLLTRTHSHRLYSPPAITVATNASDFTLLPLTKPNLYLPKVTTLILIGDSQAYLSPSTLSLNISQEQQNVPKLTRLSVPQQSVAVPVPASLSQYLSRSSMLGLWQQQQNLVYLLNSTAPLLIQGNVSHHLQLLPIINSVPISSLTYTPETLKYQVKAWIEENAAVTSTNLKSTLFQSLAPAADVNDLFRAHCSLLHSRSSSLIKLRSSTVVEALISPSTSKLRAPILIGNRSGSSIGNAAMTSAKTMKTLFNVNDMFRALCSLLHTSLSLINLQSSNTLPVPMQVPSRQYRGFPQLLPPNDNKPSDAMDCNTLNAKYAKAQAVPQSTVQEAVTEIKYFACPSLTNSTQPPNFRVHNLRASCLANDKVYNLVDKIDQAELESAKEEIHKDLKANNIDVNDLEKIWYNDRGTPLDFWAYSMVKHSKFSKKDRIDGYASLTHKLAAPVLTGSHTLGEFLKKKGFTAGKYHEVQDLMVALKEYFKGKDAYPTFVCQDDRIIHHCTRLAS